MSLHLHRSDPIHQPCQLRQTVPWDISDFFSGQMIRWTSLAPWEFEFFPPTLSAAANGALEQNDFVSARRAGSRFGLRFGIGEGRILCEKKIEFNLFVSEVYYTNYSILLIKNMLCGNPHCQRF